MTTRLPPVLSPVDYDAWNRGYMPPTEHVLIDALTYRGARVVSSSAGHGYGFWLVIQGTIPREKLVALSKRIHLEIEDLRADEPEAPSASAPPPVPKEPEPAADR